MVRAHAARALKNAVSPAVRSVTISNTGTSNAVSLAHRRAQALTAIDTHVPPNDVGRSAIELLVHPRTAISVAIVMHAARNLVGAATTVSPAHLQDIMSTHSASPARQIVHF